MDSSKVQTIQDWPEPHKVKDVQSFLGFANFYCCFISDYSDIVILLTWLTCKGIPWNFTNAAWKSFQALKSTFISTPVLTHWVPDKPIIVETNASDYALGAILSIQTNSNESTPWLSIPAPSVPWNSIMTPTTKNCSQSLRLSMSGNTSSKVPVMCATQIYPL